jgi:excisionase family DNA binding protein
MTYSVKDLCERFGIGEHTILAWIRCGELRAVNVGRSLRAKKPRWRITAEALAAFEQQRTPAPPLPRTRRKRQPADIIQRY